MISTSTNKLNKLVFSYGLQLYRINVEQVCFTSLCKKLGFSIAG